jgi:hypothetical protein
MSKPSLKERIERAERVCSEGERARMDILLPQMYCDFGPSLVTITVGFGHTTREFILHKSLITSSSSFFRSAFDGSFIESSNQHLSLPEDHPDVFEALCDWLYSRQIREPALYTKSLIPDDLFWLRMYVMADRQDDALLQGYAKEKIKGFNPPGQVPSAAFIAELFDTPLPSMYLEYYVVHYAASKLAFHGKDWKAWTRALKAHDQFGSEVAIRLTKLRSADYQWTKYAPKDDPRFAQEVFDDTQFEEDISETEKEPR